MGVKITKRRVDALKAGETLYDDEVKGFVVRKLPSGVISYGFRYRNGNAQSRWAALGLHGSITADEARILAKKRAGEVADGRDPVAERERHRAEARKAKLAEKNTVDGVLTAYVAAHVRGLRSARQVERALDFYVRPRLGATSIYDLKKSDVQSMLDEVRTKHGPIMSDRVLSHVRAALNWQADRDDDFRPPVIRPRKKTESERGGRTRVLADDELRSVWSALNSKAVPAPFPNIVRVLLLTGQRRNEVAMMDGAEIDGNRWVIPAARYKIGVDHEVPLTDAALQWISRKGTGPIFRSPAGKKPFSAFGSAKSSLDGVIAEERRAAGLRPLARWTLHDLRRTARSLMARAGVTGDIGEMVLGHVLPGVRGVYDRHKYEAEKRDALEKLAQTISSILGEGR